MDSRQAARKNAVLLSSQWLFGRTHLGLRHIGQQHCEFSDVQATELEDPSAFVVPGSLILTTGLKFVDAPTGWAQYVSRLAAAGVVGIGFGTGVATPEVPPALITAAATHGMTLFDVPVDIPFISIIHAVYSEQARQENAAYQWLQTVQMRLNRDAVSGDVTVMVERAAVSLAASIAVVDDDKRIQCAATAPGCTAHAAEIAQSMVDAGHTTTTAMQWDGAQVQLQRMSTHGDRFHVMVVARDGEPFGPQERSVVQHCAGLADIVLQRPAYLRRSRNELNSLAMALLLGYEHDGASLGHAFEKAVDAQGRTRPVVIRSEYPEVIQAARAAVDRRLQGQSRTLFALELGQGSMLFLFRGTRDVTETIRPFGPLRKQLAIAVGAPVLWHELTRGHVDELLWRVHAAGLGTVLGPMDSTVSWLADPAVRRALAARAAETFDQLEAGPEPELAQTLELFLRLGGQVAKTAAALGVHRHTVRTRIERIEQLHSVDLSDPIVRAELLIVAISRH